MAQYKIHFNIYQLNPPILPNFQLYMTTVRVWQLGGLLDIFFHHNCFARYFFYPKGLLDIFGGICTIPHQLSNGPPLTHRSFAPK